VHRIAILASLMLVLLYLTGCQTTPANSPNPDRTPVVRSVEVLSEIPDRYREIGPVIAQIWEPVVGYNTHVTREWKYFSPWESDWTNEEIQGQPQPSHADVRLAHRNNRPQIGPRLQQALKDVAAEQGADAVVIRASGFTEAGSIWISGVAIKRQ
jgi:hypothetical protein